MNINGAFNTPLISYSFPVSRSVGITCNLSIFFINQPGPVFKIGTYPVGKIGNRWNLCFKGDGSIPDIGCVNSKHSYASVGVCQANHGIKIKAALRFRKAKFDFRCLGRNLYFCRPITGSPPRRTEVQSTGTSLIIKYLPG